MSKRNAGNYKTPLTLFALAVAVYGILGWMDVANYAQGGWNTDGNNTVTEVLPGSPAEAAGLAVGDYILSLDGIATTDARSLSRRARPAVGETWEFVVERDGDTHSLDVTFAEPVMERKLIAHAGFFVGYCFIVFTLLAFLKRQTDSTLILAIAGTLCSLAFITGPYFATHTLRSVDNAVSTLLVFLGIASILNFVLLHFRSGSNRGIYIPALAAGAFIGYRILATPEATTALNTFGNIFIGLIVASYLVVSLMCVVRAYRSTSPKDRASQGLNLMMIGALIGLLPALTAVLSGVVAPRVVLPGQSFYFLSLVFLPLTWSLAMLKASAPER